MGTILAITKNTDSTIKLIQCVSHEEAIEKMKKLYSVLCAEKQYDYHNTYIDEELGYAQIANGFEQTEIRTGQLNSNKYINNK